MKFIKLVPAIFIIFFLTPYLILVFHISLAQIFDGHELWWAIQNSFLQSFLSASLSLFFGGMGALGLAWLRDVHPKWLSWAEGLILLPNFLPPLFIVFSVFYWIHPFPFGLWGISFTHSLMNVGLVSFLLHRILCHKIGGFAELAVIEGASRSLFLKTVLSLLLREMFLVWISVFFICWTSFAVPLLTGGDRGFTLEVLIYQKIRWNGDLSEALSLAFVQLGLLWTLSWFLPLSSVQRRERPGPLFLLHQAWGLVFPVTALLLVMTAPFLNLLQHPWVLFENEDLRQQIPKALLNSIGIAILTGSLVFLYLQLSLVWSERKIVKKFFQVFQPPSVALMGFSLILWGVKNPMVKPWLVSLALSWMFYPLLFRMIWKERLDALRGQVLMAQTLGASDWQIFRDITFSQSKSLAGALSGIAAFWALGDFSLPTFVLSEDATLAQLMQGLLEGYRMNWAGAFNILMICVGGLVFLFFKELPYVYRRKPSSSL